MDDRKRRGLGGDNVNFLEGVKIEHRNHGEQKCDDCFSYNFMLYPYNTLLKRTQCLSIKLFLFGTAFSNLSRAALLVTKLSFLSVSFMNYHCDTAVILLCRHSTSRYE